MRRIWLLGLLLLAGALVLTLSACAPAAAPTPTPTKPPAAVPATPTTAPATAVPTASPRPTAVPATPTAKPAAVKVRFASPAFVSDAGVFIAQEKGYFKAQDIDSELVSIKSATDAPPLMARGDLEVAGGSASAGLYNAIARGIDLKIVADKGSCPKGFDLGGMFVRKDLVDQIKTVPDLKGRKIGISCTICSGEYFALGILKGGGLTLKDVEMVEMAAPDLLMALANKSIDVAYFTEPNPTQAAERGLGVYWKKCDEGEPDGQAGVIIYSDTFAKNVDAARRWMQAYLMGVREYNDAFLKNKNKPEVASILAKYGPLKDLSLYNKMGMPGLHPDGKMNADSLFKQQEFFVERGAMQQRVDLKKAIDTQFIEYAAQKLGPYK